MENLMLPQSDPIFSRITFIPRLIMAVLAGFFICIGGEFEHTIELARLPSFYTALFSSMLIAFIAVEQVNYSVLRLRRRFPDEIFSNDRSYRQIFACFIMPFVLIFCLASTYYALHGLLIFDTMWIADHAAHILLMLLSLNMVFLIMEFVAKKPIEAIIEDTLPPIVPVQEISTDGKIIAFIKHEHGANIVTYLNGNTNVDLHSIEDIYQTLNPNLYTMNGRDSIVRRDNIKKAHRLITKKCRLEFYLPEGASIQISGRQSLQYIGYFNRK
jgi:hypothetical protein